MRVWNNHFAAMSRPEHIAPPEEVLLLQDEPLNMLLLLLLHVCLVAFRVRVFLCVIAGGVVLVFVVVLCDGPL